MGKRRPVRDKPAIVFDEAARRDFLTGFRKRKNERKQLARQKIAAKVRKEKIEERQERREAKKANNSVGLGDGQPTDSKPSLEAAAAAAEVSTYHFQDTLTTTVVEPLLDDDPPVVEAVEEAAARSRGEGAPKPKARKFNLNVPLATAIPGYVPPKQRSGGPKKKKEKKGKAKRLVSKREKARQRAPQR